MIATYNTHVGDVLMLIVKNSEGKKLNFERKEKIARVFREDDNETVAWNIFEAKSILTELSNLSQNGPVNLTENEIEKLNHALLSAGFDEQVVQDNQPKFVVAEIIEMRAHPDSDHLHICKVNVGLETPAQIVCGAPNAAIGLKTVAALPGAMMPNGALIFSGELRGIVSDGMLCSARELELLNAPQVRGIIELAADLTAGMVFNAEQMWSA